MVDPGGADF
jgi:hypothetical protein